MTLEHLDTFIAFAVVMLGVSLIVTILVQMASGLFGLRGTNLKWGVAQLLKMVHPEFAQHAEAMADRVLNHPLISDSSFSKIEESGRLARAFGWVLQKTPWLSRWKLATTVRPEELLGILEKLGTPAPAGTAPANFTVEQAMHQIANVARGTSGPELKALAAQVRELVAALPPAAGAAALQIDQLLQKVPNTAEASVNDLKSWFNAAMDRVSQRFAAHTRLWTIAFSVALAFALHLDAFRLLKQISSDAEIRAGLVQSADTMMKQATALQPGQKSEKPPAPTTPDQVKSNPPDSASQFPNAYLDALNDLQNDRVKKAIKANDAPHSFGSREEAVEWLQKTMQGAAETKTIIDEYQLKVDGRLKGEPDKLLDRAASVKYTLAKGKFQLIPEPYHDWDLAPSWPHQPRGCWWAFWEYLWPPSNLHFWGTFFSAALLSLGAPFWFSALKTMSALRPAIANKQEKEQKQSPAL